MKTNSIFMTFLPWLLIVFGFFTLGMFQGYIAITCMVIGITMLLERIWPEKWGADNKPEIN